MKKYQNEIVGLYFNNGIQGIGTIVEEDENFMWVENLLGIQVHADSNDANKTKLSLEDFTPFTIIQKEGLTTRIPHSAIMLTFPPVDIILSGYKQRTSRIITM